MLFSVLDNAASYLSDSLFGYLLRFSVDDFQIFFCEVAAIPIGVAILRLPTKSPLWVQCKHFLNFLVGVLFSYYLLKRDIFSLFPLSLLIYGLSYLNVHYFPRTPMIFIVLAWVIGFSSLFYHHHQYEENFSYNLSIMEMFFTARFVHYSYTIGDFMMKKQGIPLAGKPKIHEIRSLRAVPHFPTVFEFLGYLWHYGAIFYGPAFDFHYYLDITNGEYIHQQNIHSMPNTWIPALIRLFQALVVQMINMKLFRLFPIYSYLVDPQSIYWKSPFWKQLFYNWIGLLITKIEFYALWYFSEAGLIAGGYGFRGPKKELYRKLKENRGELENSYLYNQHSTRIGELIENYIFPYDQWFESTRLYDWSLLSNSRPLLVEFPLNYNQMSNSWNIYIQRWMKENIYWRILFPGAEWYSFKDSRWFHGFSRFFHSQWSAWIFTRGLMAVWHGFNSGFYIFFSSLLLLGWLSNAMRQFEWHYFGVEYKKSDVALASTSPLEDEEFPNILHQNRPRWHRFLYDFIHWGFNLSHMSVNGMAFIIIEWEYNQRLLQSMYYFIYWFPPLMVGILAIVKRIMFPKKKKKKTVVGGGEKMEQEKASGENTSSGISSIPTGGKKPAKLEGKKDR